MMLASVLMNTNYDTSDRVKLAKAMESVSLKSLCGPISINPNNHGLIQNICISQVVKQSDGTRLDTIVKTYPNMPEIGGLLANGLPALLKRTREICTSS